MTYKEAKYWFNHNGSTIEQESEMIKVINEALGKQIPKPVVKVKLRDKEWGSPYRCPECEVDQIPVEFVSFDGTEQEEKTAWCWRCGQALDWEANE